MSVAENLERPAVRPLETHTWGTAADVANTDIWTHRRNDDEIADLAAVLYGALPYDFRGEQGNGSDPFYRAPVLPEQGGCLFVRCIRPCIEASQFHADAPRLRDAQWAAMDA